MKLAQRAEISENFKTEYRKFAKEKLMDLNNQLQEQQMSKNLFVQQYGPAIKHLYDIVSDDKKFEFEITRLRLLNYTKLDAAKAPFYFDFGAKLQEFPCIYGETHDVIIRYRGKKYNLGPYRVYIAWKMFFATRTPAGKINPNFIPALRDNIRYSRHPHHTKFNTCWGGFSPIVTSLERSGDVVEFLRTVYCYLCTYDPSSKLDARYSLEHYPWVTVMP